jgi:hypothetical protein
VNSESQAKHHGQDQYHWSFIAGSFLEQRKIADPGGDRSLSGLIFQGRLQVDSIGE